MNSLAIRKGSRAMSVVFVACLAVAAHASPNVFDDAVFWFRGGKDDGDHFMQQGEFFDDLHADDASHPNHLMGVLPYDSPALAAGFKTNAVFRNENVVFPALGTNIVKEMQVLRFSDTVIPYSVNNEELSLAAICKAL